MSLIYFHKFLIFCAILFALFYAWQNFSAWRDNASLGSLGMAAFSAAAAVGLVFYLRTVKLPSGPEDKQEKPS